MIKPLEQTEINMYLESIVISEFADRLSKADIQTLNGLLNLIAENEVELHSISIIRRLYAS